MKNVGRIPLGQKKMSQMFASLYKFWYNVEHIQKREGIL